MPTLANALKHSTLNEPNTITYEVEEDGRVVTNHGPSTRVGLIVHKAGDGFATRVNNLYSYLEINRRVRRDNQCHRKMQLLKNSMQFLEREAQNQSGLLVKGPLIDAKAQISTDSNIGQSTRVEERASIKKSVVGRHCVIGKMVKIAGCVILDHCVIGDGCDSRLFFTVIP